MRHSLLHLSLLCVVISGFAQQDPYFVVSEEEGDLVFYNHQFEVIRRTSTGMSLSDVAVDQEGQIYLASGGKVYRYEEDTNSKTLFYEDLRLDEDGHNPWAYGISIDSGGEILICQSSESSFRRFDFNKSGLSTFDPNFQFTFRFLRDTDGSLEGEVYGLTRDNERDYIWISFSGQQFHPGGLIGLSLEELSALENPDTYFFRNTTSLPIGPNDLAMDSRGSLYALARNSLYTLDPVAFELDKVVELGSFDTGAGITGLAFFHGEDKDLRYQPSTLVFQDAMVGAGLSKDLSIVNMSMDAIVIHPRTESPSLAVRGGGELLPGDTTILTVTYFAQSVGDIQDYLILDLNGREDSIPILGSSIVLGAKPKAEEVLVYPNPFSDGVEVQISLAGIHEITVRDMSGRMWKTAQLDGRDQNILDFSYLPPGIYHFQLVTKTGEVYIEKMLKK